MDPRHAKARDRRQKIISMGPDLPTRQEVADAIGCDLKTADNDIRILMVRGEINSVTPAVKVRLPQPTIDAIRADYLDRGYLDDIAARHGVTERKVRELCRGLTRQNVSAHRPPVFPASHTTVQPHCISTTYSPTEARARSFQAAYSAAADRYTAAARLRAAQ